MSEPFGYFLDGEFYKTKQRRLKSNGGGYFEGQIALYEHPDPRVAELEAVLRECRDVIEEAQTYCEGPQWSPSMAHDCGTAIAKIDEVLPK